MAIAGKEKMPFEPRSSDPELLSRIKEIAAGRIRESQQIRSKDERYAALGKLGEEVREVLGGEYNELEIIGAYSNVKKKSMRSILRSTGRRIDGRATDEIRKVSCEVGILPRVHGSGLFTRGETQALTTTTLGTRRDEQKIDALTGERWEPFLLHYNFPPYSVGEVRFLRGASRREIGHGKLAERALRQILPSHDDFPYTIRIVSETLESNGSSSMAAVCGGSLSLMDCGVPITRPVAGIAMGLVKDEDDVFVLTDILGDEDHMGDMDFKVCGTREGITALQMDIKMAGIDRKILDKALSQAREARLAILDHMEKAIPGPRQELSPYAPRILCIWIKPDKIRDVIGPGGKVIRGITEQTGASIDVEDSGKVMIASPDLEMANKALEIIKGLTEEAEVGKIYMGTVQKVVPFGAFVEILPGTDGLVHISELSEKRVRQVEDVLKEGDEVMVKVINVDRDGKIKLSRKQALADQKAGVNR